MSLRYLVPSLGLLACTAGFATAADVGGLSINGYVDSTLAFESLGDDLVVAGTRAGVHKSKAADGSNTVIDFASSAQLEVGYKVGDVKANIELYYTEAGVALEQAYVNWAVSKDEVNIKMGRMDNGLGLEGMDKPELYRVNWSNMFLSGILGGSGVPTLAKSTASSMFIDGVQVGFKAGQISGAVGIADGVYQPMVGKDNTSLALMGTVKFVQEKVISIKGSLVYDMDAGVDDSGEETGVFALDLVAESDVVKDLKLAGELTYVNYGEPSAIGFLAMANYKLPTGVPMSVTGMLDYLMMDSGDETGSELEIAVALLANPTKEDNFATNLEARFISRDLEDLGGGEDMDEFGIFFEMVAVIP